MIIRTCLYLCQTTVVSLWLVIPRPFSLSRETPSFFNCSATAWFWIGNQLIFVFEINLDANLHRLKEFQRVLLHPAEFKVKTMFEKNNHKDTRMNVHLSWGKSCLTSC